MEWGGIDGSGLKEQTRPSTSFLVNSQLFCLFLASGSKQEEGQEAITKLSFITVQVPCDIFWRNSLSCLDPSQHAKELPGAVPGAKWTGKQPPGISCDIGNLRSKIFPLLNVIFPGGSYARRKSHVWPSMPGWGYSWGTRLSTMIATGKWFFLVSVPVCR